MQNQGRVVETGRGHNPGFSEAFLYRQQVKTVKSKAVLICSLLGTSGIERRMIF
jgi:hypothetical protein